MKIIKHEHFKPLAFLAGFIVVVSIISVILSILIKPEPVVRSFADGTVISSDIGLFGKVTSAGVQYNISVKLNSGRIIDLTHRVVLKIGKAVCIKIRKKVSSGVESFSVSSESKCAPKSELL